MGKEAKEKELIKEAIKEVLWELRHELNLFGARWLSTKDAIRYSGLSKDVLYKLYKNGEIYATTVGGGKLIWDRNSIDEYFLRQKNEVALKAREILSLSKKR